MADGETNTETQSPQVMPGAGLPEASTPEGAGAGVGAAVAQGAMVGLRVQSDEQAAALQEENHRDQVMALAGSTDVQSYDINGLHGKNGLFAKDPGSNARQLGDDYLAKRAVYAAKVREGLSPQAQERFDLHERERALDTQRQVYEWQDRSDKAFDQKVVGAKLQNTANNAVLAVNEPDPTKRSYAVNQSLAEGSMTIIDQAERQGLDFSKPEDAVVIQQRLDTFTSSIVGEVMNGLVDKGDTQGARAFYDEHKDDLTAKDRIQVERLMRAGDERDRSRALSDSILHDQATEAQGDPLKMSEEDALKRLDAKNITDTKVYDEARARLLGDFRERRAAHDDMQRSLMTAAGQELEDPTNTEHGVSLSLLERMDPRNHEAITTWQRKLIKEGKVTKSDENAKALLYEMTQPDQWDAFLKIPKEQWRPLLSDQDFDRYQREYAHAQTQVEKRDNKLSQGAIEFKVTQDLFHDLGLAQAEGAKSGSPGYEATRQLQDRFMDHLHRAVGEQQLEKKRPLTEGEVRAVASELSTRTEWTVPPSWVDQNIPTPLTFLSGVTGGRVPSRIWDSTKASGMAFQVPWGDKIVYQAREIPQAQRPKILETLAKQGVKDPTDRDLIEAYNRGIEAQYRAQHR